MRTLRSLTGLRAVAAGLVFLRHSQYLFNSNGLNWVTWRLFVQGGVGVSFFFVLSGFILTWSWRPGTFSFYRRRFARIYPAYITSVLLGGLIVWRFGGHVTPHAVIAVVFLVQSWSRNYNTFIALNGVTWSLSCEAFFYLVFPLLFFLAVRAPLWVRRLALVACVSAVIAVPVFTLSLQATIVDKLWFAYIFPPVRLLEFACGVFVALEVRDGSWFRVPLWAAWPIAIVGYLLAGQAGLWHPRSFTVYDGYAAVTIVPFLILIAAYATRDLEGRKTRMASPVAVRLGEISYAFFLIHFLVIQVFEHYTPTWRPGPASAILALLSLLIVSLSLAAALYFLIERPAERRLRPTAMRPEAAALAA